MAADSLDKNVQDKTDNQATGSPPGAETQMSPESTEQIRATDHFYSAVKTIGPASSGSPDDAGLDPAVLGDYELIDKLGEGGMGEISLATDSKLDRPGAWAAMCPTQHSRTGGIASCYAITPFR